MKENKNKKEMIEKNESGYIIVFSPELNQFAIVPNGTRSWWHDEQVFESERKAIEHFNRNITTYIVWHYRARLQAKEEGWILPATVVLANIMKYWDYHKVVSKYICLKRGKKGGTYENN